MENTYSGVVKAELRLLTLSVNRWMGDGWLFAFNASNITQAGQEINVNANT